MTRGFLRFARGNTIALLALFIALGGTTYAATALPANSVGAKQLKKNAVTAVKLKAAAVTTAKIANNAVTGAKVKNGSITGADVLESSLGQVPSALNATTAGTAAPTGAAGGALSGSYPAPTLANDTVGGANVVDASQATGLRKADIGAVYTETASFDPPSIAAQSCSSASANVPGAQSNDVIIAHPINAIWSNLMYAPWLTGTDSVSLRICNPTGAAIDGPAVNFRILLIR